MPVRTPNDGFIEFRAAFEGEAVDTGRMPAKQFAGSLLALTDLIEQSATVEFQREDAIVVEVRSDLRHGSFDFGLLAAAASTGPHLLAAISQTDLRGLLRHIGLLGGLGKKTLLGIVKRFGPRPVAEIRQDGDNNVAVVINFGDHAQVLTNVDPTVAKLLASEPVRSTLPEVVKPLLAQGIDSLRIGSKTKPDFKIVRSDAPNFEAPVSQGRELTDSVAETGLELLSAHFVEGHAWRVAQGGQPFHARVLDVDFIRRVNDGERFAKGDFLIVELRTRTFATSKGIRLEREIVRVKDHIQRPSQGSLFA